ncbi:hypothetical protein J6590_072274 [Homalodisca vitripennis]|nr:hypothetical protein J6590_072274 [Homalodisca vitripennis]
MDFTLDYTQKGRPCIIFLKHKYRLKRTLVNGDISWCCLGKNCGASVRTDSHKTVLTVVNEKHSGQHPVTMRSLTPDSPPTPLTRSAPRSNGASPSVLSLQDSLSASPLLSPLTGRKSRSDSGTRSEDNHMKTKDELIERINQLTHQQSCLVLQCQSMLLQLEEKDNELSSLKNTPTQAKEVAVQTEELSGTNEEPCQRCVILNEETRNMIQTIRTLEEEHVSPCCKIFVDACSGAPMSHVLDNAHSMTENFTKDDTVVVIAGANDLSDVTTKNKQPARVLVDEVKNGVNVSSPSRSLELLHQQGSEGYQHRAAGESRGGESRDGGRVIIGETFIHPTRAASQPEGKLVLSDMIAVAARRLRLAARHPTTVVGLRPGLASRISSSAKSQMHERLRTPLPTNCLQHESYAGAVRSTPRTGLRLPAAVVGAPADAPGVSSASGRSPVAVQPSSPPSPAASCVSTSIPLEPVTSDIGTLSDAVNTFPNVPNEGNQRTNLKNYF